MNKKGKKGGKLPEHANNVGETVVNQPIAPEQPELPVAAHELPVESVIAELPVAPTVLPEENHEIQEKKDLLFKQVQAIAKGREWRNVVHSFMRRNGMKGGTNLQFYFDCKTTEIETGQECDFVEPVSEPMVQVVQRANGFAPMLSNPKAMKTRSCPTCN